MSSRSSNQLTTTTLSTDSSAQQDQLIAAYKNAENLFQAKQYEATLLVLDEAKKIDRDNDYHNYEAWSRRAYSHCALGQIDEAKKAYDHAIYIVANHPQKVSPSDIPWAYWNRGTFHAYTSKNYQQALSDMNEFFNKTHNSIAVPEITNIKRKLGLPDKQIALEYFQQAEKLFQAKQYQATLSVLDTEVNKVDWDTQYYNYKAWGMRAYSHSALGQIDEAKKAYDHAIYIVANHPQKVSPSDIPWAYFNRGKFHFEKTQNYQQALSDMNEFFNRTHNPIAVPEIAKLKAMITQFSLADGRATVDVTCNPDNAEYFVCFKSDAKQDFSCIVREVKAESDLSTLNYKSSLGSSNDLMIAVTSSLVHQESQQYTSLPDNKKHLAAIASVVLKNISEFHSMMEKPKSLTNFDSTVQSIGVLKQNILKSDVMIYEKNGLFFGKRSEKNESRWTMGQHIDLPNESHASRESDDEHCVGAVCHVVSTASNTLHIMGKHINPMIERIVLSIENMERVHAAPDVASYPEKLLCATLGTGTQFGMTYLAVKKLKAVVSGTTKLAKLIGIPLASGTAYAFNEFSKKIGDSVQNACHTTFRLLDEPIEFVQGIHNPSFTPTPSMDRDGISLLSKLREFHISTHSGKMIETNTNIIGLGTFNPVKPLPLAWDPKLPKVAQIVASPAPMITAQQTSAKIIHQVLSQPVAYNRRSRVVIQPQPSVRSLKNERVQTEIYLNKLNKQKAPQQTTSLQTQAPIKRVSVVKNSQPNIQVSTGITLSGGGDPKVVAKNFVSDMKSLVKPISKSLSPKSSSGSWSQSFMGHTRHAYKNSNGEWQFPSFPPGIQEKYETAQKEWLKKKGLQKSR